MSDATPGTIGPAPRRTGVKAAILGASAAVALAAVVAAMQVTVFAHSDRTPLHFSPNGNFDGAGHFLPGVAGFDLADVSDVRLLDTLPTGVKALVWVGQCNGVDDLFVKTVEPFIGRPEVFGYYLMDAPDPRVLEPAVTGSKRCLPESLKAESDWIHARSKMARTFIILMNLAPSGAPSFKDTYTTENSHVDLFGIDPYPCRSEKLGCDFGMIDRYVAAAEVWGISRESMVPIYQTFGGGTWDDGDGGKYLLPDAAQMKAMLDRWHSLLPAPVFDYAYTWGQQSGSRALSDTPQLQALLVEYRRSGTGR